MINSILPSSCLNYLSSDILKSIFAYKCLRENLPVISQVCHLWNSFVHERLEKSARKNLTGRIEVSVEEVEKIVKIVKNNNLIAMVKANTKLWTHSVDSKTLPNCILKSNLPEALCITCERISFSGFSDRFKVIWNETTGELKNKGSHGEYCTFISIRTYGNTYQNLLTVFADQLQLMACCDNNFKRKSNHKWRDIKQDLMIPSQMGKILEEAFSIQLKMYVDHVTAQNMQTLKDVNYTSFLDENMKPIREIYFDCFCNGKIRKNTDDEPGLICFIIKIKYLDKFPLLTLELPGVVTLFPIEHNHTVTDMIRWSVLSTTVKKLSFKIGIGFS
jgi:hypothetical protein